MYYNINNFTIKYYLYDKNDINHEILHREKFYINWKYSINIMKFSLDYQYITYLKNICRMLFDAINNLNLTFTDYYTVCFTGEEKNKSMSLENYIKCLIWNRRMCKRTNTIFSFILDCRHYYYSYHDNDLEIIVEKIKIRFSYVPVEEDILEDYPKVDDLNEEEIIRRSKKWVNIIINMPLIKFIVDLYNYDETTSKFEGDITNNNLI